MLPSTQKTLFPNTPLEQKELIQKNNELVGNKNLLIAERNEKEVFFVEQINHSRKLDQEIIRSREIIDKIKENEQFYKTKLIQQQQQVKEIEDKIKKIIEEEIRKARDEAKKNNLETPLTPESLELSVEFETNRQLNNFSIIFYKRLKQNIKVNEY